MAPLKLKTPCRYPGGKSKALAQISKMLPDKRFPWYIEPCVGGGSVFIHLKQQNFAENYWINDLYFPVAAFWLALRDENTELYNRLSVLLLEINAPTNRSSRIPCKDELDARLRARTLYNAIVKLSPASVLEEAVRFAFINRCTFSGISDCGGFSAEASTRRFTKSIIDSYVRFERFLTKVKITSKDLLDIIPTIPKGAFVYIDPPYYSSKNLYGNKGSTHKNFSHTRLAELLCSYSNNFSFLMTYDKAVLTDSKLLSMYSTFDIKHWSLQYGMDSFAASKKDSQAKLGSEIFIRNYLG